ncbi:MAG TPA: universal stress protein [Rubrivivax sp.]|nr:universal stress protein [Rubrivivax sp.]
MRHILLATDGSDGAQRATDVAVELAKGLGAALTIVCVSGHLELSRREIRELERAEGSVGEALDESSRRISAHAAADAHAAGVSSVHAEPGWGDPAEQIIDTANRLQADAIVMGRRGHGRLTGLLLGSVSQKVASLALCVVILVP